MDIIQEVNEELKRENFHQLWNKYGRYVIGCAVGVVLFTALYTAWQNYSHTKNQQEAQQYAAAYDLAEAGDKDAALQAMAKVADSADSGYRALARLNQAGLLIGMGKKEDAVGVYRALAADTKVDPIFRDIGRVYAAMHMVDTAPRPEIDALLAPVNNDTNPWRHSAREILAIAAYQDKDLTTARDLLGKLSTDATAPQKMRDRATKMLDVLSEDAPATTKESAGNS